MYQEGAARASGERFVRLHSVVVGDCIEDGLQHLLVSVVDRLRIDLVAVRDGHHRLLGQRDSVLRFDKTWGFHGALRNELSDKS